MIGLGGIGKGVNSGAHSNNEPMDLWKWGGSNFFDLVPTYSMPW